MSYEKRTQYQVICDQCGLSQSGYYSDCWYESKEEATKMAEEDDWEYDPATDSHLCFECAEAKRREEERRKRREAMNAVRPLTDEEMRQSFDLAFVSRLNNVDQLDEESLDILWEDWMAEHDRKVAERAVNDFKTKEGMDDDDSHPLYAFGAFGAFGRADTGRPDTDPEF